jgi:serine/threonine protein kinase
LFFNQKTPKKYLLLKKKEKIMSSSSNEQYFIGEGSYGKIYALNDNIVNKVQIVEKDKFIPGNILVENDILKNCKHPNIVSYLNSQINSDESSKEIKITTQMEKCDISMYDWLNRYHHHNGYHYNFLASFDKLKASIFKEKEKEKIDEKTFDTQINNDDNVNDEKINANNLIKYLYEILSGLSYLHKKHIIHGDLKWNNIMLKLMRRQSSKLKKQLKENDNDNDVDEYQAKIIDFGMAQYIFDNQVRKQFIQTSIYCAPEVILNYRYYDERVDMWSFGIMMFEAIFDSQISWLLSTNPTMKELNKILQDYLNVFGVPKLTKEWSKIIESAIDYYKYKDTHDNDNDNKHNKNQSNTNNNSYIIQFLANLVNVNDSNNDYHNADNNNHLIDIDTVSSSNFENWIKNTIPKQYALAKNRYCENQLKLIIDLIFKCLKIDPSTRIHSNDAKSHPLFYRYNYDHHDDSNSDLNLIYFNHDNNNLHGSQTQTKQTTNSTNIITNSPLIKARIYNELKRYYNFFSNNQNIQNLCWDLLDQMILPSKSNTLFNNLLARYSDEIVSVSIYLLVVAFNQNTNQEEDNDILNGIINDLNIQSDYIPYIKIIQMKLIQELNWNFMSHNFRKNLIPLIGYL